MTNLEKRYKTLSEAMFKTFVEGDVEAQVSLWAEGCTRTSIDAFGEHSVIQGQDAIREAAKGWASWKDLRLLKNEILSTSEEKGIGNAVVRWTGSDGREWSCDFIYVITLDENDRCVSYIEWNVVKPKGE